MDLRQSDVFDADLFVMEDTGSVLVRISAEVWGWSLEKWQEC